MENSDNRETSYEECSDGYSSLTDEKLASLYSGSGDREAFNRIALRYGDKVFGFALKMIRVHHDAEDVKQEVFILLLEKMRTFKGNSRFSTWLYRITLNACFMKLNKYKRKSRSEVSLVHSGTAGYAGNPSGWKSIEELADYREFMEFVEDVLKLLPERNRMVFRLRNIEALSNAEAGVRLGMSESAFKSQILRTRIFIRVWVSSRFRSGENRRMPDGQQSQFA
jgi:RNA polymerase sigma-70 factor (ECF subfamily)